MQYQRLKQTHPDYDAAYWRQCLALYKGDRALLGDRDLMERIFPRHLAEKPEVYEERRKRAFYINYAGSIIDTILAELFAERLSVTFEPEPDGYYYDFLENCAHPQGREMSLNQLLRQQMLTALQCQRAWTLVDLPRLAEAPGSMLDQERMGGLSAYAVPLAPESVLDWEYSDAGELLWVLLHFERCKRLSPEDDRGTIVEEFVYYTRDECVRYATAPYRRDTPPKPTDEVPEVARIPLTCGCVPVISLELSDGLYAMGKLRSIAVAHLNTRNALSWAEHKSLFPVATHFAGDINPLNPITEDPNRAVSQTRGQGHIVTLPAGDDFRFIGPDPAPFAQAAADLATLRDEMYRVVHHMALSVDNSGAALQRSAESKTVDQAATSIVLKALGGVAIEHVRSLLRLVCRQRGDVTRDNVPLYLPTIKGMEEFQSEVGAGSLLEQAKVLATLEMPAPLFWERFRFMLAKRILGDDASEEDLQQLATELSQAAERARKALVKPPVVPSLMTAAEDREEPDDE